MLCKPLGTAIDFLFLTLLLEQRDLRLFLLTAKTQRTGIILILLPVQTNLHQIAHYRRTILSQQLIQICLSFFGIGIQHLVDELQRLIKGCILQSMAGTAKKIINGNTALHHINLLALCVSCHL